MENRVNVLYLTTKCNLACDYCYEEASRLGLPEQITLEREDIDKYLNEIVEREKGVTSTVVIMGGEPFMKYHLLYYTVGEMKKLDHSFGVSVVTNATELLNISMIKELLEIKGRNTSLTFELSYDVSGHFRRVYRNSDKSSRKVVEETIQDFVDHKIPFKISYTLHKGNYNNFVKDMIYIFERFGTKYLKEVKISPYCQELSTYFGGSYQTALNVLKPYANALMRRYNVTMCDLCCGVTCFKCDKSNFVGKSYCGPKGINYENLKTEKIFDCWGNNE